MDLQLITVSISLGVVVVVIVVTVLAYRAWQRKLAAATAGGCALVTDPIFPDLCVGRCPVGQGCGPVKTRPYLIFFKQHATCACAVGVTPAVPAPPLGAPGPAGAQPSHADGVAHIDESTHPH